jgi:hypothetical protein
VAQTNALGRRYAGDRGDLKEDQILNFAGGDAQLPPAEAGEVGQARMCSDGHLSAPGELYCLAEN